MQQAIFAAVEDPAAGNLVIEALAGTGKSTTIEECVKRTDGDQSVLVCAFNASIAKELKPRMPADVEVSTIHSFGFRALGASSSVRLEVNKFHVADMVQQVLGREYSSREARSAVVKLVGIAKGQAFTWKRLDPLRTLDAWADAFGIEFPRG
jgi:superfamily I DNA/RNA helicase